MRKIKRIGEGETQLFVAIFEKSKLRNGVKHAQKKKHSNGLGTRKEKKTKMKQLNAKKTR